MNILVIYAHPYNQSFNHAIKETIVMSANSTGNLVEVRDLYALDFDPVLCAEELVNSFKGNPVLADVAIEQNYIRWADMVVFVYPLWWAGMPAILRGYLDRVLSFGFAYTADENGTTGLLGNKQIVMINTIGATQQDYEANGMLKALETIANPGIFNFCGTAVKKYFQFCAIPSSTPEERQMILSEVSEFFQSL
ncbi:MAG: NAD(P)H-dependent oxidoreductase [Burkholderiales bacterium]|nr:NAD(P)H-dependent oxidoreductase [Burkholderiales bacterium]